MNGTDLASHPRDIARFAMASASADEGAALVFVTAVEGGSVRAPGLRMAITAGGDSVGFVSNGCVEADLIAVAVEAIAAGEVTSVSYGQGSGKIDIVLPCGGRIDLLIVPLRDEHMEPLRQFTAATRTSGQLLLSGDGTLQWHMAEAPRGENGFVFVVHPKIRLLVIGAGAEALVLARLASAADMNVEVISPDEATLARAAEWGLAVQLLKGLSTPPALDLDGGTAVALMFHDHEWELRVLEEALGGPAFYIGALGSRRAHGRRVEALLGAGCSEAAIGRIRAPIGLVHQLRDPHLLAASVIAEVAAAFQEEYTAF